MAARLRQPGPKLPLAAMGRLDLGHGAAEAAVRALVAGGARRLEQPLGRDPPLRPLHALGDQVGDDVG
jgi:hypothetical protein